SHCVVIIQSRCGGRMYYSYDAEDAGSWGDVLALDLPNRLLLAWRIDAEFTFNPDLLTEVEVNFTPEAGGQTRVDFEHRLLENLGEGAERVRESLNNGWAPILEAYAQTASN